LVATAEVDLIGRLASEGGMGNNRIDYVEEYNTQMPHSAFGGQTPPQVILVREVI
jgi:transposase InsO family protein